MTAVPFAGERGDIEGSTTWAQEAVWRGIRPDRPNDGYTNARFSIPVPPGADVLSAVGRVMTVHEGLRTTFPDTGAERLGRQRVHREGMIDVPTVELSDRSIESFVEEWGQQTFDTMRDWPARFAIVRSGDGSVALAGAVSHLVADKLGEGALVRDFRALLDGRDLWPGPDRVTAVGRAADEAGDRLKVSSHRAVQRWADMLDAPANFEPAPAESRCWRRASLISPMATLAAEEIAARTRASTASVFMAATAVLVSAMTGRESAAMASLLSNRFSVAEVAFVGTLVQPWGLTLDIGALCFDDIVRAAYRVSLRSYRVGRYNPYDLYALRAELRDRKGLADLPWFDCLHNDSRSTRTRSMARRGAGERILTRHIDLARFGLGYRLFVEIREAGELAEIFVIANARFDAKAIAIAIESFVDRVASGVENPAREVMAVALDSAR
ncbi:condensation domain-containing protein [Kutzneria sp. NPDC052558]|uniref:condensation domain-containing protein n=1 Tax=Kutzneria sp. NPDC052558 TaxID=3364121 RepID=UPI0037C58ED6